MQPRVSKRLVLAALVFLLSACSKPDVSETVITDDLARAMENVGVWLIIGLPGVARVFWR